MSLTPTLRHGVGLPLYAGIKTCVQLETPTRRIPLIPRRTHYKLGDGLAERLLISTGYTPGHLSSATRQYDIRAQ